jgi:hypothetical protein
MAKYRKKPVIIEAVQFREGNFQEILSFSLGKAKRRIAYEGNTPIETNTIDISTLEGTMNAIEGDYIIKDIEGEFYPCKPHIFDNSYELIE